MTKTPKASLIIACYKHTDYLEKILYSLLNQTFKHFEIIIAEDGQYASMLEVTSKFKDKFEFPIKHLQHEDKGFRKTIIVNAAALASSSDYLIFIDGDCILHHEFVGRHYRRREHGVVLAGRRIMLNENTTKAITINDIKTREFEKQSFLSKEYSIKERKRGLYIPFIYHILNQFVKHYYAYGSNFSIHKNDFLAVNGYDETIIGRGLEDVNLTERFKLKNYRIKRLTYEAIQFHLHHSSDPVPHSTEIESIISNPTNFYTVNGILKNNLSAEI